MNWGDILHITSAILLLLGAMALFVREVEKRLEKYIKDTNMTISISMTSLRLVLSMIKKIDEMSPDENKTRDIGDKLILHLFIIPFVILNNLKRILEVDILKFIKKHFRKIGLILLIAGTATTIIEALI